MLYFSIPPPCKAQKPTMKKNCCVIFQHPAALQGPKNLYKEGNRCVIFQHSAALQGPKTSIKRGIAVLYFSIPPPCRAQKPSMKKNCCVILQHPAALQGPKNLYEEEPLCYTSAFRRSARPKNSPPLRQKIFMENTRISQTCRRGYLDAFRLVL